MIRKKLGASILKRCSVFLCLAAVCAAVSSAQDKSFGWLLPQPLHLPEIALDAKPMMSAAAGSRSPGEPRSPGRYAESERRWNLEAGVAFVRFQSSIFYASMVGFKTTLGYDLNSWVAAEGGVTTGFAPTIYLNEHVKYLDYMAGIRIGPNQDRFVPWARVLIGGAHLQPQTAGNTRNSFAFKAGVGTDYRMLEELSVRIQADWLRTRFFNQSQNNFQAGLGLVFHF